MDVWKSAWGLMVDGALSGDFTDGGELCYSHLPLATKTTEAMFAIPAFGGLYLLIRALARQGNSGLDLSHVTTVPRTSTDIFLGTLLAVVYLWELYYKVVTRKVIFMLQPCHVVALMQIIALWAPSGRGSVWLVTQMTGWLFGPLIALVTPDTSTLHLPWEVELYWIEHGLIVLVVPLYLLCRKGPTGVPRVHIMYPNIFVWIEAALGIQLYHWLVLHPVGHATWVNVNFMLCPPAGMDHLFELLGPLELYRSRMSLASLVMAWTVMVLYVSVAHLAAPLKTARGDSKKCR
eukprot:Rmarinus@m.13000